MSAAACLHADDARRELLDQLRQCNSSDAAAENDLAFSVQSNDATNIFAKVDSEHVDIHWRILQISFLRLRPRWGEGQAIP
jgi:hypothetical protein